MLSNVLVIGNDKGGAGKSTLTANLAGQLAVAGWRTLVVDLDYQGDVSEHLGYADNPENDGGRNLMNAMVDGEPLRVLKDVGGHQGLDAIPAGRWTRLLTQHLASDSPEHDLETVLSAVASDYSADHLRYPPRGGQPAVAAGAGHGQVRRDPIQEGQERQSERQEV